MNKIDLKFNIEEKYIEFVAKLIAKVKYKRSDPNNDNEEFEKIFIEENWDNEKDNAKELLELTLAANSLSMRANVKLRGLALSPVVDNMVIADDLTIKFRDSVIEVLIAINGSEKDDV